MVPWVSFVKGVIRCVAESVRDIVSGRGVGVERAGRSKPCVPGETTRERGGEREEGLGEAQGSRKVSERERGACVVLLYY